MNLSATITQVNWLKSKMTSMNVIWYAETSNFPSSSVPKKYDGTSDLAEFRCSPRRNAGTVAYSRLHLIYT